DWLSLLHPPQIPATRFVLAYMLFFSFTATATTEIYTLSLHDALPILLCDYKHVEIIEAHGMKDHIHMLVSIPPKLAVADFMGYRSEEHTSELQSRFDLVCRLLLEKKKQQIF